MNRSGPAEGTQVKKPIQRAVSPCHRRSDRVIPGRSCVRRTIRTPGARASLAGIRLALHSQSGVHESLGLKRTLADVGAEFCASGKLQLSKGRVSKPGPALHECRQQLPAV
jgi:hypothetical protein